MSCASATQHGISFYCISSPLSSLSSCHRCLTLTGPVSLTWNCKAFPTDGEIRRRSQIKLSSLRLFMHSTRVSLNFTTFLLVGSLNVYRHHTKRFRAQTCFINNICTWTVDRFDVSLLKIHPSSNFKKKVVWFIIDTWLGRCLWSALRYKYIYALLRLAPIEVR